MRKLVLIMSLFSVVALGAVTRKQLLEAQVVRLTADKAALDAAYAQRTLEIQSQKEVVQAAIATLPSPSPSPSASPSPH